MIYIDPQTRQRVSYQPECRDLQYDRKNGSALSTMPINIAISGISRNNQMNLGRSNAFFGTDLAIIGKTLPDLDVTGHNKQTTTRIQWRPRVNV